METRRPRVLILGGPLPAAGSVVVAPEAERVLADTLDDGLTLLRQSSFDVVLANAQSPTLREEAAVLERADRLYQKLDALHQAGRELAPLDPTQLAEVSMEERVEFLKHNLRRLTHDLLHYDVIEVRVLNRQTGRLDLLLAEGMSPEAVERVLYARATGNGVTGHVAFTGQSYLCPDAAADPLYLPGAPGARSSMTVPLKVQDEVIGTFNVESPHLNAFTAEDLQFTELFSRELAQALYTLELLSAQQNCAASHSIDTVTREVALPVDDMLAAATTLLTRTDPNDPELREQLHRIIAGARSIKQCIQKVGEDLVPPSSVKTDTPAAKLKGLAVLVVDNDDRVRRSAHGILGRFGCEVETAATGTQAAAMAQVGPYDAIVSDINLPDLPGIDAYRLFRQTQPQARVILMTGFGYDSRHSLVKARQEGLRFVLFKPFRVDQLLDSLVGPEPASPTPAAALQV